MSDICHHPDCMNHGTNYHDRSIGGCGDIRHYCDDHIEQANAERAVWCHQNKLKYHISLVKLKQAQLNEALAQLEVIEAQTPGIN